MAKKNEKKAPFQSFTASNVAVIEGGDGTPPEPNWKDIYRDAEKEARAINTGRRCARH